MNDLVPFEQLQRMAAVMGKGKMFGKTPEDLLPLMLIAQAENKHPAIAALEYDIIQGRPAINSKAALARFQASGGRIQWTKRTDTECSATFEHPQGGKLEITWTMKRAETAGLTGKDNWKKYPAQMLSARVVSEGVRAIFPACLSGMYTVEETADFDLPVVPSMRNVTPEPGPSEACDERCTEAVQQLAILLESCSLSPKGYEAVKEILERGETDYLILEDALARARANADAVAKKKEAANG
jgi:hypothetical protein